MPNYVHKNSNHPPSVIRNIPLSVNKRLSTISSNKEVFDAAAPPYQAALDRAGYNHQLEFDENAGTNTGRRRRRNRRNKNPTYFLPPWNDNVKTAIGKEFLEIIDTSFPVGNPLHGKLNRHNLKISYSTMPNMKTQVGRHNNRILV